MTASEIRTAQRACNAFTAKYLKGITPLIVDGKEGKLTTTRIIHCKYWLGYQGRRTGDVTHRFLERLAKPKSTKLASLGVVKLGIQRRIAERHRWRVLKARAAATRGVTTYDGVPVAKWMVPYLDWARSHGWTGRLVSGFRDPAYSESLCIAMCGAPRCPGRCAGRVSNHSGDTKPQGAVDVSDYTRFGELMARCPLDPKLTNHLPNDRVHFSVSGG